MGPPIPFPLGIFGNAFATIPPAGWRSRLLLSTMQCTRQPAPGELMQYHVSAGPWLGSLALSQVFPVRVSFPWELSFQMTA